MDFKKLPEGTEAIDLWYTLHDAELKSVTSSITARTLTLELSAAVRPEETANTDFILQFEGVAAVRVQSHQDYEPKFNGRATSPEMSIEEENRLWREHWSKGRWCSKDWSSFENEVKEMLDANYTFYLQEAQLFRSENSIILRLTLEDDITEVVIDAVSFRMIDGNSKSFTLTEFVEFGRAAWEKMRQRAEQN